MESALESAFLPRISNALPPMMIAGIALIAIGVALIGTSFPALISNPAFTAYNYYEDNLDINAQLGLMSLGALVIGLGSVLLAKGVKVREAARKRSVK